jgi:putative regulatory protein, FmdB family
MPNYDYRCRKCGARAEANVSIAQRDFDGPNCKACNGYPMDREVSAPAFKLVGTGFHRNDYAGTDRAKSIRHDK